MRLWAGVICQLLFMVGLDAGAECVVSRLSLGGDQEAQTLLSATPNFDAVVLKDNSLVEFFDTTRELWSVLGEVGDDVHLQKKYQDSVLVQVRSTPANQITIATYVFEVIASPRYAVRTSLQTSTFGDARFAVGLRDVPHRISVRCTP